MYKTTSQTIFMGIVAVATAALLVEARAESGQVLERGTNKPIAGVFVVAEWHGVAGIAVQNRSRCYYTEYTKTDSEGRFSVSTFSWNLNPLILDRVRSISAYTPGFKQTSKDSEKDSDKRGVIYLESRAGTPQEQFAEIVRRPLGGHCEGNSDDINSVPLRRAQAMELNALATTDKEHYIADGYLLGADRIEFGEMVAEKKFDLLQIERRSAKRSEVKP